MTPLSNQLTLEAMRELPTPQLTVLDAEELMLLQEEATEALRLAKQDVALLDAVLRRRYEELARMARQDEGKDTGTVRLSDGPVTVIADLPKKVSWDQRKLAELAARIEAEGDDPTEYLETSFKVSERKYTAWPTHIKDVFLPARTLGTGKPSFRLVPAGEGGAQ